jgi:flagellar hook-associated protein 1 FlgK
MSTFSGISTALSSLQAQRQALEVAGQNIANAGTAGYTRQRADLTAVSASTPAMFSTSTSVGGGVRVTDVQRLSDAFLDAKVRAATTAAGTLSAQATAYSTLETTLGEPAKTALSGQLSALWSAWSDAGNQPDDGAARSVVLEDARTVVGTLQTLYRGVASQWDQTRTSTVSLVDQVNASAASVADLNDRIRAITTSGGSANELQDQRDQLVTQLSSLVGATTQARADGTVDVLVGGGTLVQGAHAAALAVAGATSFAQAAGGSAVTIEWADRPGATVALTGGQVAGQLHVLGPADPSGTGGVLTEAAAQVDAVATALATQVNALHQAAYTTDGQAGGELFHLDPGSASAALGLSVAVTDPTRIALSDDPAKPLDGSVGDAISRLGASAGGPDATWASAVVTIGTRAQAASSRAAVAEAARSTAEQQQVANASVDVDSETVDMLSFQRSYEGAARVLTAIDDMLDTLINKTGSVGR